MLNTYRKPIDRARQSCVSNHRPLLLIEPCRVKVAHSNELTSEQPALHAVVVRAVLGPEIITFLFCKGKSDTPREHLLYDVANKFMNWISVGWYQCDHAFVIHVQFINSLTR